MPSSKTFQKNFTQAKSTKKNVSPCDSVVVTPVGETRVWTGALRNISNTEWYIWTSLFHIKSYKLPGILIFACPCFEGQSFSPSLLTDLARHQDSQEAAEKKTKRICHAGSKPCGRREFCTGAAWGKRPSLHRLLPQTPTNHENYMVKVK